MKKTKRFSSLTVIIAMLFVTGMTFTNAFHSGNKLGVSVAFGDEGEGDDDKTEVDKHDEENDEKDEADKADNEDSKKNDEEKDIQKEKSKKEVKRTRATIQRTMVQEEEGDNNAGQKENNDGNEMTMKSKTRMICRKKSKS